MCLPLAGNSIGQVVYLVVPAVSRGVCPLFAIGWGLQKYRTDMSEQERQTETDRQTPPPPRGRVRREEG